MYASKYRELTAGKTKMKMIMIIIKTLITITIIIINYDTNN